MRVTAETKAATRQRILEAARQLLPRTASRPAPRATLPMPPGSPAARFSTISPPRKTYWPLWPARQSPERTAISKNGERAWVLLKRSCLRSSRPDCASSSHCESTCPVLLETVLNPLAAAPVEEGQSLRLSHLETVARLAKKHRVGELSPVALQLYWTLYTGVLMFWAQDRSPKQEDTLALLDQSLAMFVGWLQRE